MRQAVFLLLILWAAGASAELYTWKGADGASHYTNQPDTIPQKYRKRMKVIPMPGDQKKEQAPGNPGAPGGGISLPLPPPPPATAATPAPSPTPAPSATPSPSRTPETQPARSRGYRRNRAAEDE